MAAYAAVVTLKAKFTTFLRYYDVIIPELLEISELVLKELKSFLGFVERLDSRSRKRMSASLERIVEAVHDFDKMEEDQMEESTNFFLETLKKVKEEYYNSLLEDGDGEEVVSSSPLSSLKMVGLRDERSKLKEALMNQSLTKIVFLLAGMAGIGKTTLAREVFEDLDVSEWFECRVWVRVGIEWKGEEITKAILAQVNPDGHEVVMGGDEEEIAQQLEESLKGKRYLIVLDDVWDTYVATKYLERLLPHSENSSRVVLTSRMKGLDYKDFWYVFEIRLLNKEESWDLLCEKVFVGGLCPPQLEKVGKKIAIKCDGLPLTIVTVAGLLSMAGETPASLWIDVAEKRKHQIFIDAYDQISKVLYPSYEKLRDDLKLCFLYMGVFPLKYEISRSKLINLWTAEEIFDKENTTWNGIPYYDHDLESLKCLDECSLIMVYQKSSTYVFLPCFSIQAISKCGLHSSWWHFCQREARKINFFYVLDCYQDGLEEGIRCQSRLSIQNNVLFALKDVYNSIEENCASSAQSLLCFGPYNQYMVPLCYGLKFLQRIDALNIRFYDFPMEVLKLVMLSYLALTCNGKLPPSISKLGRLQYLTVHPHLSIKPPHGAPSYMPMEIWDLEELKHLEVVGWDLPDLGDTSLGKLLTLSDVSTRSYTVLNRLPNLKKLKIRIELTPDAAEDPLCCSNHISNLINLKSLKCIVVNPGCKFQVVPPVASFPVLPYSLKKLSLSGLGYPWEQMREIAILPHLEQLKLRCNAFQGQYWEVEGRGFRSLNFLLIEDIDLVKLVGSRQSFGVLHHLSIKHCYKLEEIQLGRSQDITRFEVIDSNPLVGKSIKQIALRMGQEPEHFLIHHSWKSA